MSAVGAAALALGAQAHAQGLSQTIALSVDWQSGSVGLLDSTYALPITEGDVLVPPPPTGFPRIGPLPVPSIAIKAGPPTGGPLSHLGLAGHPLCVGHAGGTPCVVEVDALDLGQSMLLQPPTVLGPRSMYYFSVDKFAVGFGAAVPANIGSEGPVGDLSADVLVDLGCGNGPLAPFTAGTLGSTGSVDGNGMISGSGFRYPGTGLREPNMPVIGPTGGDNLDGLMFMQPLLPPLTFPGTGVYFSLDSGFVDPLTGIPNTASAAFHGFVGGDVVWTPVPGGAPVLYAPAAALGLDFFGPDTDDLDALALAENNQTGYQVSNVLYDWLNAAGQTDMLLFSVRRGSAVIGMPDSIFGIPISEGDILVPPQMFGVSPFPGIFIAAENLGLRTARSFGPGWDDDLDALEVPWHALMDCNGNGIDDAVDIRIGGAADTNNDGIPDSCQPPPPLIVTPYCFCNVGPCGNNFPTAGCRNSTGIGALLSASGSTSVGLDNLVLTTTGMPPFRNTIQFMSSTNGPGVPFADGKKCLFGAISRFPVGLSSAGGSVVYGPGLSAYSIGFFPAFNWILAGSTFHFQTWYRDPTGPCGLNTNLSSAIKAVFVP